jgi:hypothetical protein
MRNAVESTELFRTTKNFLFLAKGSGVERSTAQSIELMMIGRTLIDEVFERWLMLQQPADADDARKNKRADSSKMQKEGETETAALFEKHKEALKSLLCFAINYVLLRN